MIEQRSHVTGKTKTVQDKELDFAIRDIGELILLSLSISNDLNNISLNDLIDVDITTITPNVNDIFTFDGTNWIPSAPAVVAAPTLANVLIAGKLSGANDIVMEGYKGIVSPQGDSLFMGNGSIELVADYNGTYAAGVYATTGQQYSALFFSGWGGAYEGGDNFTGSGGFANIYTKGYLGNKVVAGFYDDPTAKNGQPDFLIVNTTLGNLAQGIVPSFKKAAMLLASASTIGQDCKMDAIVSATDSTITLSEYSLILGSTFSNISGDATSTIVASAIIASRDILMRYGISGGVVLGSSSSSGMNASGGVIEDSSVISSSGSFMLAGATRASIIASFGGTSTGTNSLIGASASCVDAGFTNIAILGCTSITAKASNSLYANLRTQVTGFDGIFSVPTLTADRTYTFQDLSGTVAFQETDIVSNAVAGIKIGLSTTHKLGFYNATPVIQPASANQAALTNSTTGTYDGTLIDVGAVFSQANINNNFTDLFTLQNEMRTVLVNNGLMKGSA